MGIAVSVMFFVAAVVWLGIALYERDMIAVLMFLVSAAAGVLNIVLPNAGIHIAVGIMAFVEAVWCLILLVWVVSENDGDTGVILGLGAFLLFAWAVTFGILQLVIVV
jgi:hypothetical protein